MFTIFNADFMCEVLVFSLLRIQYCAKVMRAKFVELRCFSVLFNGIQRIFERNDLSTKYSRNITASIVLIQSELSYCATKSRSVCNEFSSEVSTNLTNFRYSFVKVPTTFRLLFTFPEFSRDFDDSYDYSVDMATVFVYS